MLGLAHPLVGASQFAAGGLRDIYLNDSLRQLLGRSLSLGTFPADTVLANLKTSARVTSLFILLLGNGYEYMIGGQASNLTLTP